MSMKAGSAVAALLGMLVTGVIGFSLGKSKAQERIHALQQEILRIQAIEHQRNLEVRELQANVAALDAELDAVGVQREALGQFIDWLGATHPDILARYQHIQASEANVSSLEWQSREGRDRVKGQFALVRQQHPNEAANLLATHGDFLS